MIVFCHVVAKRWDIIDSSLALSPSSPLPTLASSFPVAKRIEVETNCWKESSSLLAPKIFLSTSNARVLVVCAAGLILSNALFWAPFCKCAHKCLLTGITDTVRVEKNHCTFTEQRLAPNDDKLRTQRGKVIFFRALFSWFLMNSVRLESLSFFTAKVSRVCVREFIA